MGKVFFDVGISLDGFIAGLNGGLANPLGDGGLVIGRKKFSLVYLFMFLLTRNETPGKEKEEQLFFLQMMIYIKF